ncbi:MAG: DUF4856 domain-containing protein [Crocinitomicaceae bacterium]|jgi:hypothetical protein|tara:strand:+ start:7574 stop:8731 length:1158 start_codon:yes stop_codon:yes gene_type:complete
MKKLLLLLSLIVLVSLASCKKKGCTDPLANNYNTEAEKDDESCIYDLAPSYSVPSTYTFMDADGNNTVSFSGQTARLDMLSEMTNYLKSANGINEVPATLDGPTLLSMYDNSYANWADNALVGNGKQLKNKTALGDVGIQAQFEIWMNDAAAASPSVNGSYLQAPSGHEWTQLIEKGLMSACFANQMTSNYLADIQSDENTVAIDPLLGKYYTEMEHHWDEAYGYFTDAVDYPTNGADRFWGKYANNTLETLLGSATAISEAFRTGRAAIAAGITADVPAQVAIIQEEARRMVAGMAIHYLNSTKQKVADGETQNTVNHYMSEAYAFIYGIQFCENPDMSSETVNGLLAQIDADFEGFTQNVSNINNLIDTLAIATGLENEKNDL